MLFTSMKQLFTLILLSLLSLKMNAQKQFPSLDYGVKFGLSISELQGAENLKSVRPSFSTGLISEYRFTEKYAFQVELLYSRQGSTNRGNDQGAFYEERIDLDYFNLPLLGKYYMDKGLAFELGPQIGYLADANYENKIAGNSLKSSVEDDFHDYDISLALGMSYKTDWGFLVGARYSFGLNDINKGTNLESGRLRNAVFQLYFGYLFK